jgi:hypothetical protein
MRERPILFSGPMVNAILDDRKTQTRRVIPARFLQKYPISGFESEDAWRRFALDRSPYKVGDLLWVRETFEIVDDPAAAFADEERDIDTPFGHYHPALAIRGGPNGERFVVDYKADGPTRICDKPHPKTGKILRKWKPAIHMPKWAARIWLEITDVRVQRVQDISAEDAISEGCPTALDAGAHCVDGMRSECVWFMDLWNRINFARGYGWDTNPWVWALTFRKVART